MKIAIFLAFVFIIIPARGVAAEICTVPQSNAHAWTVANKPTEIPMCRVKNDALTILQVAEDRLAMLWPDQTKWHHFDISEPRLSIGERHEGKLLPETKQTKIAMLAGLSIVDYIQTVTFLYRIPGQPVIQYCNQVTSQGFVQTPYVTYTPYTEGNPLLGPRPSRSKLVVFGIVGVVTAALLVSWLPEPWSRIVRDSIVESEAQNVVNNDAFLASGRYQGPIPIVVSLRW